MPRRLAEQRMTLSDLEWPFHASRAISAVAELLVKSGDRMQPLNNIHEYNVKLAEHSELRSLLISRHG